MLDAALRAGHLPAARLRPRPVRHLQGAGARRRGRPRRGLDLRADGLRARRGQVAWPAARRRSPTSTIEADIDEEPDAAVICRCATSPARSRRIDDLTPTIKGVCIELDERRSHFQAGQYVNLRAARAGQAARLLDRQRRRRRRRRDRAERAPRAGRRGHHLDPRAAEGRRPAAAARPLRSLLRAQVGAACRCCSWPAARACRARAR